MLLIPMVIVLSAPPLVATVVGFVTHSLVYEYATLLGFAILSVGFYFLVIRFHARTLARREIEILEAVREPADE